MIYKRMPEAAYGAVNVKEVLRRVSELQFLIPSIFIEKQA
jgi:hypothetical protein